jgi:hypothetical protein
MSDDRWNWEGEKIISRNGSSVGYLTGSWKHCTLEGCSGVRVMARWPDGKWTWPCTEGLKWDAVRQGYKII